MLEFFGARAETGIQSKSYKCDTVESLEMVLKDEEFGKGNCIQVCEIFMDQYDYPWRLTEQIAISKAMIAKMTARK